MPKGTRRARATSINGHAIATRRTGAHSAAGGHQTIGRLQPVTGYADADGKETVEAWDCVQDCPVRLLDEQSSERGVHPAGAATTATPNGGRAFAASSYTHGGTGGRLGDSGGASRFFFCPKVSTFEREFGCEGLPLRDTTETVQRDPESKGLNLNSGERAGTACADGGEHTPVEVGRGAKVRNHHVSLKPIALIKYLATLIKPPGDGARLLVPFSGAGSEMIGAMRAGWADIVGIEKDPEYVAIAEARLKRWADVPAHVDPLDSKPPAPVEGQRSLFG